jgi:Transcription factor S-II (TFIIS), central domain
VPTRNCVVLCAELMSYAASTSYNSAHHSLLIILIITLNTLQMVDILSEHLSQNTDKKVAKLLSCHIETSIHNLYDFMADKKAYMDKFRSLSYNMKINEGLRKEIVEGRLMPESLVRLSPQEMATEEQRKKRDDVLRNEFMSRRTDYYETHRADILVSHSQLHFLMLYISPLPQCVSRRIHRTLYPSILPYPILSDATYTVPFVTCHSPTITYEHNNHIISTAAREWNRSQ